MNQENPHPDTKRLTTLTLAALGVVFGDIGTSPLYAVRECFSTAHGVAITPHNVYGALSLIVWVLIVVVSLKYVLFIMSADNKGEGGELALMALIHPKQHSGRRFWVRAPVVLGLFGAALLYGDGMITPAISVLSAIEGLTVVTPLFSPYVLPVTVVILICLFGAQRSGTGRIGSVFGPIILSWFLVLGVLGVRGILLHPQVLAAVSPHYAVSFLMQERWHAFVVLGSVFLAVTGAEALFADMGHFGKKPIRVGWFAVALPCLLLNYFGQSALLLSNPSSSSNPFYLLAPAWALIPLVVLATMATVIASQAVIAGAFSITRQAVLLGYLPRLGVSHTSSREIGQIYVPMVNRLLLVSTLWLVLEFRSSSNLAAAYGMGVSTTMIISTFLMFFVTREVWGWKLGYTLAAILPLAVIDLGLFGANLIMFPSGGWFPLLVGVIIFTLMSTWQRGREILAERLRAGLLPLESYIHDLVENPPLRVPGIAVFLTRNVDSVPAAMRHHVDHNKVLHERVVVLAFVIEEVPAVDAYDRVQIEGLGEEFYRVVAHYGFMESPNVPEVLSLCKDQGFDLDIAQATFFLGRETIIAADRPGMARWRDGLFALMARNAERPGDFFKLPRGRVVEIGLQVEI